MDGRSESHLESVGTLKLGHIQSLLKIKLYKEQKKKEDQSIPICVKSTLDIYKFFI